MIKFAFEKKTFWGKEKTLVASVFSFSQNVFKSPLPQGHETSGECGKELTLYQTFAISYFLPLVRSL